MGICQSMPNTALKSSNRIPRIPSHSFDMPTLRNVWEYVSSTATVVEATRVHYRPHVGVILRTRCGLQTGADGTEHGWWGR